jgi:hypothetical protein
LTRSGRFIGYPIDQLLTAFRDPDRAATAAADVLTTGVPRSDVTILRGDDGADRLDGTGAAHGPIARLRRVVSFTLMDQLPDMAWYERAVRDGGAVVMVRVRGDAAKAQVVETMRRHGGHFINYYGRFATEEIDRWSGPEPDVHDLLKR